MARCLVTGASGYVGSRLVAALLRAGHDVVAAGRDPGGLRRFDYADRVDRVRLDVADEDSLAPALAGVDVAYYLVHAIGQGDFRAKDRDGARAFATAARRAGVSRVVYLGGLTPADEELSEHLASRWEVGEVLAEHGPELVWARAGVVLGAGSASYEVVRYMGDWLPVIPVPGWLRSRVQPIAVDDALRYLVAGADVLPPGGYDLGGAEALPYVDLVSRYLRVAGQRRLRVPVPVPVPLPLASWVASRLTPVAGEMVADLVASLSNTMVCDDDRVAELVPGERTTIDDALRRARVGSQLRRDRLPGVLALPDPLRLARTDADWAHRARA
ncbi:NAD(P)H-binding protein [Rhodococcus aerolatus]